MSVIRWLKLTDDGIPAREERAARRRLAEVVAERIAEARQAGDMPAATVEWVERFYDDRILPSDPDERPATPSRKEQRHSGAMLRKLGATVIAAQRQALLDMRRKREVGDDVVHKIEHELDLEEEYVRQ